MGLFRARCGCGAPPTTGGAAWNLDALPPELDYFRASEAYQVELAGFQGPMDLLLYLIDKEQVDIYDIPIALITDKFIRHIEALQTMDAEGKSWRDAKGHHVSERNFDLDAYYYAKGVEGKSSNSMNPTIATITFFFTGPVTSLPV